MEPLHSTHYQSLSSEASSEALAAAPTGQQQLGEVLAEVRELRAAIQASVDVSRQIGDVLGRQNQSILTISETLETVQQRLDQQPPAATIPDAAADDDAEEASTTEPGASEWQNIRNAFLEEYAAAEPEPELEEPEEAEPKTDHAAVDAVEDKIDDQLDALLQQLPSTVDPTVEDLAELHDALIERDQLLTALASRLRRRIAVRPTLSVEQLTELQDSLPAELTEVVERSLNCVHQQVRIGELEMSLERARISRQLNKLEDTKARLDARARQMGLTVAEDGSIDDSELSSEATGSKGRRWLGVLGFGN